MESPWISNNNIFLPKISLNSKKVSYPFDVKEKSNLPDCFPNIVVDPLPRS